MLKIDSHQHYWNLKNIEVPWVYGAPERAPIAQDFLPDRLEPLLAARQVSGTVVIQAAENEAETAWLLDLAKAHPSIKAVAGWVDLTAPDLSERLARFKAAGPYCGTRYFLVKEVDGKAFLEQAALPGLKTLADHDLACDLLFGSSQLHLFLDLFESLPHARWVLNHLCLPDLRGGNLKRWQSEMQQAARFPNVFCKVSGIMALADPAQSLAEQAKACFETVLEIFGPERLMFGSDWPVSLLSGGYFEIHDLLESLVATLSPSEQAAIWAGTAVNAYKIQGV